MTISEKIKLNIQGHRDIDFIDIDEIMDTKLFIDPYVIQALPDNFCKESNKVIKSFFSEVFKACKEDDTYRLRQLLEHGSEPNETNLGMKSVSDFGKGTSTDELVKLFYSFYKTVIKNSYYETNPLVICMYIRRFKYDKMSDLITNIIRHLLYQFTIQQCYKWNMPLAEKESFIGYYWDHISLGWKKLYGKKFIVEEKSLLLVPKLIVRNRYVVDVECYIQQYILKDIQNWHLKENSELCITKENAKGHKYIVPPTIKDLYKREVYGNVHKGYALKYSSINKASEEAFVQDILKRINTGYGSLSDIQLDEIVYRKYAKTA